MPSFSWFCCYWFWNIPYWGLKWFWAGGPPAPPPKSEPPPFLIGEENRPPSIPPPPFCLYSSLSLVRVDYKTDYSIRAYSLPGHGVSRCYPLNSLTNLLSRVLRVCPAGDRGTRRATSESYEGFSTTATSWASYRWLKWESGEIMTCMHTLC